MSQQQTFGTSGSSPSGDAIEFIQGTTGTPAGPDAGTKTVTFTSSTGDFVITSDDATNTVDFKPADQFEGTATTVGATTADLFSVPLGATPGTFQFEARVKAFNAATPAAAGFNIYATFITNGTTARLVGEQPIFNEDMALEDCDANFVASGNNAILRVLGVTGLTIVWDGETQVT